MRKYEQVGLGLLATTGLAFGSVALTGCGSDAKVSSSLSAAEKLEQANQDLDHFESDFRSAEGIILENDRYIQIPFTGDFFTPPSTGLGSGSSVELGTIAEVDLPPPQNGSDPVCETIKLPMDAGKLAIKVVVNNNNSPIYARASGNWIKFCNTLQGVPASVGFQANIAQ